jgi:anaerobic magnesium-protoporphyrin IX monomethyl ester cyclase
MNVRFSKLLLITPFFGSERYTAVLTAGMGYIAEALKNADIKYEVIDPNINSVTEIIAFVKEYQPDLIAIGIMSINYHKNYSMVNDLKKNFPEINIIIGGPHSSTFREKVFTENALIDYSVVLEGEETIVELCQGKPLNEIKGLMYRENGQFIYNGDRKFIENLDLIPFPTYTGYNLDQYPDPTIHIVTSRGCPYGCKYCPVKIAIGRVFRVRSAKNVVDELEYWYKRGVKNFGVVDDNFTLQRERVMEICDEIEKRGIKARFDLGNGIRADKADYELLKRLKEVGFVEIAFGVESANDRILKIVNKGESLESIEKAIKIACELGFEVGLFFVLGYPGETREETLNSFRFAEKYPVDYAYFYNIVPFPNTELYQYLEENKLLLSPYEHYLNSSSHWNDQPAFVSPELSLKDRVELYHMGRKITKRIQMRRIKKRLKKLGPLAGIAAYTMSIDFVQKRVMTNRMTKKVILKIKNKLWK